MKSPLLQVEPLLRQVYQNGHFALRGVDFDKIIDTYKGYMLRRKIALIALVTTAIMLIRYVFVGDLGRSAVYGALTLFSLLVFLRSNKQRKYWYDTRLYLHLLKQLECSTKRYVPRVQMQQMRKNTLVTNTSGQLSFEGQPLAKIIALGLVQCAMQLSKFNARESNGHELDVAEIEMWRQFGKNQFSEFFASAIQFRIIPQSSTEEHFVAVAAINDPDRIMVILAHFWSVDRQNQQRMINSPQTGRAKNNPPSSDEGGPTEIFDWKKLLTSGDSTDS